MITPGLPLMFYRLIDKKRDRWFQNLSETHAAQVLMRHIESRAAWHDVQIDALKTYLFLKFEGKAQPLWKLFSSGAFNTADPDAASLPPESRAYLQDHPGALAHWEYAGLTAPGGREAASTLKHALEESPWDIDDKAAWRKLYYGIRYADYRFSLPTRAGKTDLMAAFLDIDLYFALQNPKAKRFARNFLVIVPSGLTTSLVSIKQKLETFDPSRVIPEPAAGQLKRLLSFDVLDASKRVSNSLSVKNPNAKKVRFAASTTSVRGRVFVMSEAVLFDRLNEDGKPARGPAEDGRVRGADELRSMIGELPNLSIFITDVHLGDDRESQLRQVVKQWASGRGNTFVQTIGFTTTPYLNEAETIRIADRLEVRSNTVSNVVFHYPHGKGFEAGQNA